MQGRSKDKSHQNVEERTQQAGSLFVCVIDFDSRDSLKKLLIDTNWNFFFLVALRGFCSNAGKRIIFLSINFEFWLFRLSSRGALTE